MTHRIFTSLLLAVAALASSAAIASAHGENSQEGFLRMETVAFSNVQFSKDTVKQGEELVGSRPRIDLAGGHRRLHPCEVVARPQSPHLLDDPFVDLAWLREVPYLEDQLG